MKIKGQETKEAIKEIDKILEIANKYRKKKSSLCSYRRNTRKI